MSQSKKKDISLDQIVKEFRFVIDLMPQMVWATRGDGYHDFFNERWYEFTGLSFEETKNQGWSLVLHPDDYDRTWEVWQNSLDTGVTYEIEYRMRKFDGSYNWFLARAQPLRDERGNILKWFGTCTDIQEQRKLLEELQQTKAELYNANNELKNSNDELKRINLELDNFVYSASHDLKAPLNNLEGLISLLEPSKEGIANQSEIFEMMSASVKRYKQVIDDMTLIAQTAKFQYTAPQVYLAPLIEEIKSDLSNLISSNHASIFQELKVEYLHYSKKDIRSILFNLISNGIKYRHSDRPPVITVRTDSTPEGIHLEVEDNGCGIKNELIPSLFNKYFRIKSSVGGSGLGLFIVKRLVENRDGRIVVTSEEGRGSKFTVILKV
ncbi:sensor histidine kinase [Salinimicrobium xinjiangense]|uniref:sensor histidine kinase n=1 Tax=Salinimicrobium xinjiangense TaxID=438596 RepID=UPI00040F08D3|nr:PAS domain-containing sensor histidine kinase [Salinimicrobium xinjiangense]